MRRATLPVSGGRLPLEGGVELAAGPDRGCFDDGFHGARSPFITVREIEATSVADITYIPTDEGWLYLAGVLDLHSRKIVGWAMSPVIHSALVLSALSMATTHRSPPPGLLFHSDRGVQYAAGNFRAALKAAGLLASMSRRGNCYDNASVESFWSTLKLELVYRGRFTSHRHAKSEIFDFIEVFYNRHRRQAAHVHETCYGV